MKIDDFSGGLQTRLSPRQLAGNQSVVCENVDFKTTDIVPFKKLNTFADHKATTGHSFTKFKGNVYAQSASGVNPLDPSLPIFLHYLDDLYVIKKVAGSVGVLHRLVDVGGGEEFVRSGYNREQLGASAIGQLLTADSQSVAIDPTDPLIADAQSVTGNTDQITGLIETINQADNIHTRVKGLLVKVAEALQASATLTGTPKPLTMSFNSSSTRVATVLNHLTPTYAITTVTHLQFVTIGIQVDGVAIVSGSAEHIEILDELGEDYLTATADYTEYPNSIYTVVTKDRVTNTNTVHEYTYVITLYSSATQFETSYLGEIIKVTSHETKKNTITITAVTDSVIPIAPQVDFNLYDEVRIYRSGNGATIPTLIHSEPTANFTVTGGGTTAQFIYNDTDLTEDSYLTAGRLFDTLDVGEVPLFITHGIQIGNNIVLASNNKIYTSETGNQDSYPLTNVIEFNKKVVALAESSRGLLVFFDTETYLVRQLQRGRFSKTLISKDQGCATYRSVQQIGGAPYWFSKDGFCTLSSRGVRVLSKTVISDEDLTLVAGDPKGLAKVLCSGQDDEKYYAVQHHPSINETVIFVYDMSYNRRVPYSLKPSFFQITNFALIDGILIAIIGGKIYRMFSSSYGNINDFEEYTYKTGLLTDGALSKLKVYDDVYFFTLNDYPVKVTMFDEKGKIMALKEVAEKGLHNIKVSSGNASAYGVQFLLEGKATIAEIEYKIKGRSNGK